MITYPLGEKRAFPIHVSGQIPRNLEIEVRRPTAGEEARQFWQ